MTELSKLHADIDGRVQAIRADHPDWLCGKGCDGCCRQLSEVPRLANAEWDLLRDGLTALPESRLRDIRRNMVTLAGRVDRPVICPLLDRSNGVCPVYAQRPVACRTYGFYVQRGLGLYCHDIESRVALGTLADVVWGNHDAIDHQIAGLGEIRTLPEWFMCWESGR